VLGVQCHPEELAAAAPWAQSLFGWLVGAARQAAPAGRPR
jgi:gamma-glutamyl-gamma-aminobutyrate hydrolase PuuD